MKVLLENVVKLSTLSLKPLLRKEINYPNTSFPSFIQTYTSLLAKE
jgi:hypothetical protein